MFSLILEFLKKIKNNFFPFYKNSDLKFVFKKLNEDISNNKKNAMFVGGCVRKHLLNEKVDDIDIATSLTVDQIKNKFEKTKFKIIDSGIEHGTVTLVLNKLKIELTTLRKDIKTDGRHAEIEYTDDWQVDSQRRDFTINAIYLDINGNIFDPQKGIKDLKNNIVKFIGEPEKRIEEDYLRIIRFIRFSLEYMSEVEATTLDAIKLNLDGIKKISKERILSELFKILNTKNFIKLNQNKQLKNIFELVFPELKHLERLNRLNNAVFKKYFDKNFLLSVLLIDHTSNHEYFSHKYNVSNNLKEKLNLVAKNYVGLKSNKDFFSKDLKKQIYFFGKKNLFLLNILYFSNNKKMKLNDYFDTLNNIKKMNIPNFPFDGNFLKNKGMNEGALIGKTLKLIEDEWLENNFKISNEKVLEIIKSQDS